MARHNCSICEEREANFMMSSLADGATTMICIPCLPPYVVAIFEGVGLPGMTFDFPDEVLADVQDEGVIPDLTEADDPPGRDDRSPGEIEDDEWMASAQTAPPADD
jgi:hypothetical protein